MATYEQLKLDNQLCFPLYACSRKIVNNYTPYLKPLGLTYTQYLAMLVLWEEDGIRLTDLGARLRLDSGTLTPLLKKLESMGLVTRVRSKEDERSVTLSLTDAGKEMKEVAKDIPAKIGQCVALTPEEAEQLYTLLYKIL